MKQPKRKTGRTPKLTVGVGRIIIAAIAAGNFPSVAAGLGGVGVETLEKWLERGDTGVQPYADFADAYRKAELEDESAHVAIWRTAAPGDWRAAKEYLGKRYPERWSDHAGRLAVLGPGDYGSDQRGGISIILHLGPDLRPAIPVVDENVARVIEDREPGTRI
ncbi:hypothetical protein [Candidatus Binatus sp.]|uniref:hypothetical protein n=1 Tax=Candidatus Binatus sp. TaxID=2811406 RepID=UPI003C41A3F1